MEKITNQSDRIVTINGVKVSIDLLLKTFPESYFTTLFGSKFKEANQSWIVVVFPTIIDPIGTNGTRYMQQLVYRLVNGKYQYPKINPKTATAILPEADGNRFISFSEMRLLFEFLMFSEKELELVEENVEPTYTEEEEEEEDEYIYENPDDYEDDFSVVWPEEPDDDDNPLLDDSVDYYPERSIWSAHY